MRKIHLLGAAVLLAALGAGSPASAQTADEIAACRGINRPTPDQRIAGCDAMIEGGSLEGAALAPVYGLRGLGHLNKDAFDEAIADYTKALDLDPELNAARVNRGNAFQAKGDRQGAIADYDKALELDPDEPIAYSGRGRARFALGQFAPAAADFAKVLELTPDDFYASLWLYLAKSRAGDGKASDDLKAFALTVSPADWPYSIAELFLGERKPEDVMKVVGNAEQACEAAFYIGEYEVIRGDRDAAVPQLKVASEDCPKMFWESDGAIAELKRLGQ